MENMRVCWRRAWRVWQEVKGVWCGLLVEREVDGRAREEAGKGGNEKNRTQKRKGLNRQGKEEKRMGRKRRR